VRNSHFLKFALIASLVLNVTLLATAGVRAYRQSFSWISPFGQEMKRNQFLFEKLSLDPGQMKSLKEQTTAFRAEIDGRRRTIAAKHKELIVLMRREKPDARAIDAVTSEISGMQEEMQRRITRHMLEVKASLDKDNQQKFLDLIENRMTAGMPAVCPPEGHAGP
jgi:Spy/CpxP family protein refolding chaperone